MQNIHFHLDIDGHTVQRGHTVDMLFGVDELVSYVSRFFMLKTGDLLFTGTPVGVGPLQIGQHVEGFLEGFLEGERVMSFHVR